jgi:nickel-dependent lactate racemase
MSMVSGHGLAAGCLSDQAVAQVAHEGLSCLPVDGRRVLVLIPDGTRTMPMPLMIDTIERELGPRVAALDYLVALGTHAPMTDEQLTCHIGRPVINGRAGERRLFNHRWDDRATFVELGTISGDEIERLTGGRLRQPVSVALNKLVVEYDHLLICGPVFPHEVAGFSGGTKYLFPGVAAAEIIHFTHWLGALITSYEIIGTADTPVRAVIDRAACLLPTPTSLLALVVTHEGIAGIYCGDTGAAWRKAAALSARVHIRWLDRSVHRVLAIMPSMYRDLWTAAKGMYKTEPVVADGGEVVIYAPHVTQVSEVHGRLLEEIGYHCRDYFVGQWERFSRYPGGILAHSTHLRGQGSFDAGCGVERPRVAVTLATGIPRDTCARINLGYLDPATIDRAAWEAQDGTLVVPRAGELLYRVGRPPALTEADA